MKRFKRILLTLVLAGMLMVSVPAFAKAKKEMPDIDPNDLITEEQLPLDADVREPEKIEGVVYVYDEDGKLMAVPEEMIGEVMESMMKEILPSIQSLTIPLTDPGTMEEPEGPLTPDGNLSLLDDYGAPEKGGKQFITLETKSGAVFYLIIDRDDSGTETVHFLNKVDEADILAYMEDEDKEAYEERKKALEEKKEALAMAEKAVEAGKMPAEAQEEEGEKESDETSSSPGLIAIILVVAGIIAILYVFVIKKKNKPKEEPAMDPDEWDDDRVDSELADVPDEKEGENE